MCDINRSVYIWNCSCKDLSPTTSKERIVEVEGEKILFLPPSERELKKQSIKAIHYWQSKQYIMFMHKDDKFIFLQQAYLQHLSIPESLTVLLPLHLSITEYISKLHFLSI